MLKPDSTVVITPAAGELRCSVCGVPVFVYGSCIYVADCHWPVFQAFLGLWPKHAWNGVEPSQTDTTFALCESISNEEFTIHKVGGYLP